MTLPEIFLINHPEINWDVYLKQTYTHLNRSLTNTLDNKNIGVVGQASFILTLSELINPGIDPLKVIRNGGNILRHVSIGFLIIEASKETIFEIMQLTKLNITTHENITYVSGDLETWKHEIINVCQSTSKMESRFIFDTILLLFERMGLGEVWGYYNKVSLPDQTFTLEKKDL